MKINIASPGRFHVMDLARELDKLGFDIKFYSFVPNSRAKKFGLRKECNASLFCWMFPFLIISKLFSRFKIITIKVQDWITGMVMRRCDVLIAMSGNYVYTLKRAKKMGATVILERGSKHILEQKRILESAPSLKGNKPVPDVNVARELAGYELADYISIASQHVKQSFLQHNYPENRLFINPYGVDLKDFKPIPMKKEFDVVMVGGWSYQKGVDILIEACRDLDLRLLHVGSIGDIEFPVLEKFTHINPVDQKELINYYNKAQIFVLCSRQEGMALVQMQALACGLPIVCSMHTGGRDIAEITGMKDWVFEMKEYTVSSLKKEIQKALNFAAICNTHTLELNNLSWEAYGRRYSDFLREIENFSNKSCPLQNKYRTY